MTAEPYDPFPDLINGAEHRPDGINQLKNVAELAFWWHRPQLTWVTDGVTKDPDTGEPLYAAASVCACGKGEVPCPDRQLLTNLFDIEETQQ